MKKTITLTNMELVDAATAIQMLCRQEQALNPKFKLTKNKKTLESHATEYQDFRTEILNEFAERDEAGQIKLFDKEIKDKEGNVLSVERNIVAFVTPEGEATAKAKIIELNQIPVEIEYQSITINSMTAQGVDQAVLEALLWMFEEPE